MSEKREHLIAKILAGVLMSREDQKSEFQQWQEERRDENYKMIEVVMPENIHIFCSYYKYESYSGEGEVVGFDSNNHQFFIVSGAHCSCYGLEGQWDVEYYDFEQLVNYFEKQIEGIDRDRYYYDKNHEEYLNDALKLIKGED